MPGLGATLDAELHGLIESLGRFGAALGSSAVPATAAASATAAPQAPPPIIRGYTASWPIDFESFLAAMLASDDVGEISPFFDRGYLAVPAGSTKVLYSAIPNSSTGFVIYRHSMFLNPGQESASVTCTHQQDTQAPLIVDAAMTAPIVVAGAFLLPAMNRIVHTVVNSGTLDVGFNDDAQVAIVQQDFYAAVVQPILAANKTLAQQLAKGIVLSSGGAAS